MNLYKTIYDFGLIFQFSFNLLRLPGSKLLDLLRPFDLSVKKVLCLRPFCCFEDFLSYRT